jgi:hypothetical protein
MDFDLLLRANGLRFAVALVLQALRFRLQNAPFRLERREALNVEFETFDLEARPDGFRIRSERFAVQHGVTVPACRAFQ